jgi:feruloyl esterase
MHRIADSHAVPAVLMAALLAGCAAPEMGKSPVPMECGQVTTHALGIPGVTVATAAAVAASGAADSAQGYPAHCQVTGSIRPRTGLDGKAYAIGFDLRLPAVDWNGKFFYSGDAGFGGVFHDPLGTVAMGGRSNALSRGYAVVSSDSGHVSAPGQPFDGSFGLDPQARIDYGYNALGSLTPLAKKMVAQYYGRAPGRSYYAGCSKGGQSGMQAAARFADQFDGIIAGNPGFNLPKAAVTQLFDSQQLASVDPDLAKALAPRDMALVASRILAKCDALDGAADGIVNDLVACRAAFDFDADVAQCATGAAPDGACLSARQKSALEAIMGGPRTAGGEAIYADWPWDPGIAAVDWRGWKTFLNPTLAPVSMAMIFSTPPTPGVVAFSPAAASYWQGFDASRGHDLIHATDATFTVSSMGFMSPPGLERLGTLKRRAKLLVYHGAGDGVFSVNDTIRWYDRLRAGDAEASGYARLFVVPGMTHCAHGPATDRFDAFAALVDWVEKGVAPLQIIATVNPDNPDRPAAWSADRSRPLCAYPAKAVLRTGATDLESAASFICR